MRFWSDLWHRVPQVEEVEPYATTVAAFAIILIAIQILLQRRSVNADEARLARESAVFLYDVLGNEEFRAGRRIIGAKQEQDRDAMSEETKAAFKAVLHRYGLVALAFTGGGLKLEMIVSYWGAVLLKDWERLEPFVRDQQKKNPSMHRNTEVLVDAVRRHADA